MPAVSPPTGLPRKAENVPACAWALVTNGAGLLSRIAQGAKLPVSNPPFVMAFVEHTVAVGEGVIDAVGVAGIVAVRVRVGVLDVVGVAGMVGVAVRVGVLDAVGVEGIVGVAVAQEPPTDRRTSSMNQPT